VHRRGSHRLGARSLCRVGLPLEVRTQRATDLGGQAAICFEGATLELGTLLRSDLSGDDGYFLRPLHTEI